MKTDENKISKRAGYTRSHCRRECLLVGAVSSSPLHVSVRALLYVCVCVDLQKQCMASNAAHSAHNIWTTVQNSRADTNTHTHRAKRTERIQHTHHTGERENTNTHSSFILYIWCIRLPCTIFVYFWITDQTLHLYIVQQHSARAAREKIFVCAHWVYVFIPFACCVIRLESGIQYISACVCCMHPTRMINYKMNVM